MHNEDTAIEPLKAQSLMAALKEAQDTVRSYDTKAQIIGVGYIFAFDIVQRIADLLPAGVGSAPEAVRALPVRLIIAWLLIFVPLIMFARVLYPSRWSIDTPSMRTLYVPNAKTVSVDQFQDEIKRCNWEEVISTEIIQASRLRDLKRTRFVRALWAAAISYSLMFVVTIVRSAQL